MGTLTGGLYGEPIRKYYQKLSARLVAELNASGVSYFIVPWNEFDVLLNGWTEEEGDRIALSTMSWWVDMLSLLGVKKDRIIISTSRKHDVMASWGYKMEIHGVNSNYALSQCYARFGRNVFPNGDGPDSAAQGEAGDKTYKREPSVEQARMMRLLIEDNDGFGYCYFNRRVEQTDPANISRAGFDVLQALGGGR
jgi:hypothetical protein